MHVYLINVDIRLPGCRSLKEKRSRVAGLKKRLGRESYLAIAEDEHQDRHDLVSWQIALLAPNGKLATKRYGDIEKQVLEVDGDIVRYDIERV